METDFREIALRHLQDIGGVGKKDITSLAVGSHELMFATLECLQCLLIIAFYPTSLIERKGFPTALRPIFVQKPVLYHLKLKLTYSADDLTSVELVGEELRHAFIHKLLNSFLKLLGLHRVGVLYIFEHLRRETREALEMERLGLGECIADLEVSSIGYADNVARECFVDYALFLRHKCCRGSEFQCLT